MTKVFVTESMIRPSAYETAFEYAVAARSYAVFTLFAVAVIVIEVLDTESIICKPPIVVALPVGNLAASKVPALILVAFV